MIITEFLVQKLLTILIICYPISLIWALLTPGDILGPGRGGGGS